MTLSGPSWIERETELLSSLRPHCTTQEIVQILNSLGFPRGAEAVSRKARRMQLRFELLSEPIGDFSDEESAAIDAVLTKRSAPVSTPISYGNYYDVSSSSDEVEPIEVEEEDEDYWLHKTDHVQVELDPSVKWVSGSLELKTDRPTKFIMLNDVHVPHNIPLEGIWKFAKEFEPDHMLLVGDIVNNDPFDHWAKEKPGRAYKMPSPKPYYKLCEKMFFAPMRDAVGYEDECKVTFFLGNHEQWSTRAVEMEPQGEGYWEVWSNPEIEKHIDQWVPWKGVANLGHLHFTHGDVIRGGKYHPWQFLQYFNRNIRYGHYHDVGTASHTAPIDITDRHVARCNGCLEKYNPHFMENRPHNWQHAFSYGWVKPNGVFHDVQVVLIDNKFIVNGKEYGP